MSSAHPALLFAAHSSSAASSIIQGRWSAAPGRGPFDRFSGAAHASSLALASQTPVASSSKMKSEEILRDRTPTVIPESSPVSSSSSPSLSADAASPQLAARPPSPPKAEKPKPRLVGRKAALSLARTPEAVRRISDLLNGPHPQLIRIGVRNKGCAGMSYHLEYVDRPGKFDEIVEQDGVRVLIDSKALFSIIGSEMDWVEDRLSAKFAFKNPNVKDACGCGESFNLG
ncbi:hypothetical protein EW145_g2037 [Phellinidium pouzarii]|uniref:Iron-sulfur assembly protein 1 n=1 Tax=Phellinidium pouzarii TaxID=167371 RepID=A0A4S4LCW2_9AGAM|nr:hypothetical protein EW145_g2037 [Phellinidium pouzarii]